MCPAGVCFPFCPIRAAKLSALELGSCHSTHPVEMHKKRTHVNEKYLQHCLFTVLDWIALHYSMLQYITLQVIDI